MNQPLSERARQRLLVMAADISADDLPPRLPPRYRWIRELGRGGMGVVHEVRDEQLGRNVALKMLGHAADPEARRRLQREALAVARLRHPHIAAVHDATDEFLTMQLVDGGPIAILGPAAGDAERRAVVQQVRDAASALQHAHEQGLVHRDLKPSNLLVERGHVYVVDFGLAKAVDVHSSLSRAGDVLGTPAFLPPEQALGRGDAVDARSDVYGLGATLYCCLVGRPPFAAEDLPTLLRAVIEQDPPRLPGDRDLATVVATALAKEPERRYPSARAFAEDLERWLQHQPVAARPASIGYRLRKHWQRQRAMWRAVGLAAVLAIAATAAWVLPDLWREEAARKAASEAVALADQAAVVLQDAAMFTRLGDQGAAWQLLDDAIARVREFVGRHEVARARYLLSRLLRARGRADEALAELERTLQLEPGLADARFERGLMLAASTTLSASQQRLAVDDLDQTARTGSVIGEIDRLFGRAERARLSGQFESAHGLLLEVLEYEPAHIAARLSLSRIAAARGETDLARYYSASAVDLQQGYGPVYLARERQVLPTQMAGLDGALIDFAGELRDGPDNALALAHRGLVQLRRSLRLAGEGRAAESLAAAQAAVDDHAATLQLHGEIAGAHNNRAVCLLVLEQLQAANGDTAAAVASRAAARRHLERAVAALPASPAVQHNRGLLAMREAQLLRALGRLAASRQHAATAVEAFAAALAAAPPDWSVTAVARECAAAAAALVDG
ncbi:MAG: protein kinase [Planctomycetes bacterium]|nr:protein kinase [Planctomycetota bacterium]